MKLHSYIVDDIGNDHPRKNLYLKQLGELEEAMADASGEARAQLKAEYSALKRNKAKHPYTLELKKFKQAESKFRQELKQKEAAYSEKVTAEPKKIRKLLQRSFRSAQYSEFYSQYRELSFDSELLYKTHSIRQLQLAQMAEHERELNTLLAQKQAELAAAKNADQSAIEATIAQGESERHVQLKEELVSLREKRRSKIISTKAYRNEKSMCKRSHKEDLSALHLKHPVRSLNDEIKNIEHHRRIDVKSATRVMLSDISDIRRKTPIEVERRLPFLAYITFLIPGLGQLFKGQYMKAFFFLLMTVFSYGVAIPYALGYGNYQGEGLLGLVSLAAGGPKTHRSIIFMIEGIIAIFLVIIAAVVFILNFKDIRSLEKKETRGIRKNLWFESKINLERNGFPYLVSLPAFIVIIFIVLVPIMTTILLSFTNMDPSHQNKFSWVGLENYGLIVKGQGVAGGPFWLILLWTIIWTICATTLAIAVGFILSLLVNNGRVRFKKLFRSIFLLPWAVPAFITIMFFSIMLAPGGPLTDIISSLSGQIVDIKSDTTLTRISLILLQTWLGSAYIFLLITGILQGIPGDLYEAANIDGATGIQQTFKITIPLILYQTAPLMIGQYTFNFNNFSIIYLFNQGGPFNPKLYGNMAGSSDLLISYIYKLTINNKFQSVGAAIVVVTCIFLILLSYMGFRNAKAFKED